VHAQNARQEELKKMENKVEDKDINAEHAGIDFNTRKEKRF
jgi:hypothetical protein